MLKQYLTGQRNCWQVIKTCVEDYLKNGDGEKQILHEKDLT